MSILADDQRFINIKFHYLEIKDKYIAKFKFIHNQEDFEKHKNNPNLKELNTGWKILTWAEYNDILSQCEKHIDGDKKNVDVQETDFIKLRDMKLRTCLKTWDLNSEIGQFVSVDSEIIDKLNPDVANELLNGFEKVTEVANDELKILEKSAEAFLEGKRTVATPPKIVFEFFICKQLNCSFEYARNLTVPDFLKILKLCLVYEGSNKKWESELATAGLQKKSIF